MGVNSLQEWPFKACFATLTVFDDELTEGNKIGYGLVCKAQGFYKASSEDGKSQTMAFTTMFESGTVAVMLIVSASLVVHWTATSKSNLAVMGGTGKYVNAKGYATVNTFPTRSGACAEFTMYLTY